MAHAASNRETRLAGGKIVLSSPGLEPAPAVGFLHFPAVDGDHPDVRGYSAGVFGWSKVLARTLRLSLDR